MELMNQVLQIFVMAGPFIFPQILLIVVVVALAVVNAVRLHGSGAVGPERLRSVDTILFWGAVTAVIGFMGTWLGLLKGVRSMKMYGLSSVQDLFTGLSEAHITTVVGLGVLLLAGFLWFGFRTWIERRNELAG